MKASGIGGQAVMEGVMMKNGDQYAVAVRKNDDEIVVEKRDHVSLTKRVKFFGLPVIRGVIIFGESLFVGVRTLTYSARIFEEETEGENAGPKTPKEKTKEDMVMAGSVVLSIFLAVGLFMLLPFFVSNLIKNAVTSEFLRTVIEGLIRITLFIVYIAAISLMKDIKRVFMYHGAEHKSINCVENGLPLTVENVRKQSREHKRCGTSFMLYVMVLSVLFFMLIGFENFWLRILFRLLLIPVIAGVSYEFIRLAGRTTNPVITALSKPGLLLQKLTTREPDDSMIEVAITSVEAVFDWKAFIETFEENKPSHKKPANKKKKNRAAAKVVEEQEEVPGVIANVRVGGITDPIEDLDDDFDFIRADSSDKEKPVQTEQEKVTEEAKEADTVAETAESEDVAETEEAAETEDASETAEPVTEEASKVDEENVSVPENDVTEEEEAKETAPVKEAEPEEKPAESDRTEEKIKDSKNETADKDDDDHLGFFKGRRSTGKNTGMDSTPEPTPGVNRRAPVEIEKRAIPEDDNEDDEVLKKLDRFFVNKNKNKKDKTQ